MSVQTSYSYSTPRGVAGGLYDLSPYATDSRQNGEEKADALRFGMGAVRGTGGIRRPTAASSAHDFVGVVLHRAAEQTMEGTLYIQPGVTVDVLSFGRVWARLGKDAVPTDGAAVYLITDGAQAGCFTTSQDGATKIALKARFKGGKDSGDVAPAEFYYQMNESPTPPAGA